MNPELVGWSPTLAEFVAQSSNANGLSDHQRRVRQQCLDAYRAAETKKMHRRYDDGADHSDRELETAERVLRGLTDLLDEFIERAERGEIDHDELLSVVSDAQRDARRMLTASEAAQSVEGRAWEEVSVTPEQFQAAYLARMPALKQRLPRFTDAVLDGREPPSFR